MSKVTVALSPPRDDPVEKFSPVQEDDDEDSYDPLGDVKMEKEEEVVDSELQRDANFAKTQARVLTFDGSINVLADPGWDGISDLTYLESIIPNIHLIILSQTTPEYLGAFAYLLYKYPILRRIKTYSTLPISKLGRLTTAELYRSVGLVGALDDAIMEVQDIENCFNSIQTVNYAQSVPLQGNLSGITITAYNSGHTLGGSFWLFNKGAEKVIYAPVWNHSKDLFLKACRLNQPGLLRATTLISGSDLGSPLSHKARVDKFMELIKLTLINGTSVLLPTSVTGRLFELLPLLDQRVPRDINFYLVSYTGTKSLKYSANMLEWMSPDITKIWESQNQGQTPFDSNRLRLITPDELAKIEPGPKIVFVDGVDMAEGSLSRACFTELCSKHNMALILTERPEFNSTCYEIYKFWEEKVKADNNLQDGSLVILQKDFKLDIVKEEPLHGAELNRYNKKVEERRQRQKEVELEETKNDNLLDTMLGEEDDDELIGGSDDDDDEDEDDDSDEEGKGTADKANKSKTTTLTAINQSTHHNASKDEEENIPLDEILKLPMDFDVRNARGKNRMFPFIVRKVSVDDYGEVIKHSDFMREEEKFPLRKLGKGEDYDDFEEEEVEEEFVENGKRKRRKVRKTARRTRRNIRSGHGGDGSGYGDLRPQKESAFNLDPLVDPKTRTKLSVKVSIRCGLTFVDLAGLADLRSMRITFGSLKPRKVILLPNSSYGFTGDSVDVLESILAQQKHKMQDLYKQNANGALGTDYIRSKLNNKIDLGNVITSYDLIIDSELDRSLNWQTITGGYSLAHVYGEVQKISSEEESAGKPRMLKLVAPVSSNMMPVSNSISIGDVKLTELRRKLAALNHMVDFRGDGTLVVNNQLAVRKISDGNLVVDGTIGPLFYEVRDSVQSMLAYV